MPEVNTKLKLNHDRVAAIYIALGDGKIAASKHKELAVQFFYERYKFMPQVVRDCPYLLTDALLVNTQ